jgi:hypothetical protein
MLHHKSENDEKGEKKIERVTTGIMNHEFQGKLKLDRDARYASHFVLHYKTDL